MDIDKIKIMETTNLSTDQELHTLIEKVKADPPNFVGKISNTFKFLYYISPAGYLLNYDTHRLYLEIFKRV